MTVTHRIDRDYVQISRMRVLRNRLARFVLRKCPDIRSHLR